MRSVRATIFCPAHTIQFNIFHAAGCDGATVGTITPNGSWAQYTVNFTIASAGTHTLGFTSVDPGSDCDTAIASVVVN
jgi:hypothetical protein